MHNGHLATADLQILNQLYADDPTGAYTDLLDGSFTTQVVSGAAFDLSGFGAFSSVAAGGVVDQSVSYDMKGKPYGLYEEIVTFTPTSFDVPLGDSTLSPIILTIKGSVVPEPSTYIMMALGFAGLGFAGFGRKAKAPRAAAV